MSLTQKIEMIRRKPQHVRERILLVAMAVIIPIVFTVWFATFKYESSGDSNQGNQALKNIGKNLTDSTSDIIAGTTVTGAQAEQAVSQGTVASEKDSANTQSPSASANFEDTSSTSSDTSTSGMNYGTTTNDGSLDSSASDSNDQTGENSGNPTAQDQSQNTTSEQ